jgi:transcriptional regulator with XRE-family HTH domain
MSRMLEIVRHYALGIRNGRKPADAFKHLKSEVEELGVEIENGGTGADGIKGEVMDVINCALDILFLVHPETALDELDALMEAKCQKWVTKYGRDDMEDETAGVPKGGATIRELRAAGMANRQVAEIAGLELNSVECIEHGSMSFRPTQERLNNVIPILRGALDGDMAKLPYVADAKAEDGVTLRTLVAAPVVDLDAVRGWIAEMSNGSGHVWSPDVVRRSLGHDV